MLSQGFERFLLKKIGFHLCKSRANMYYGPDRDLDAFLLVKTGSNPGMKHIHNCSIFNQILLNIS